VSQLALPVGLKDSAVFDTFYRAGNEQASEALRALVPGQAGVPIWLWGPQGAGKSHLLQAACAQFTEQGGRSIYIADGPTDSPRHPELLLGLEAVDMVALDDIQLLAGDGGWERRLFHLCNELVGSGGRLVLAADRTPQAVPFRLPDLKSRLVAGLSFQLRPLDEPGCVAALGLHARRRGLELPDAAAVYLLRRVSRDMTSLCDWLAALDDAALIAKRRLTVPFIRDVLKTSAALPCGE
jgi:DnaA family protein